MEVWVMGTLASWKSVIGTVYGSRRYKGVIDEYGRRNGVE